MDTTLSAQVRSGREFVGITHLNLLWSAVCCSRRSWKRFPPPAEAGGCYFLQPVTEAVKPQRLHHSRRFLLWQVVKVVCATDSCLLGPAGLTEEVPSAVTGSQTFKLQYGTVCFMQIGCKVTSKKPQAYLLPEELLLLGVPENPWL